jgi:hypothetical protein
MKMPGVRNTWADKANDAVYRVMAYRALTEDEMVAAVERYYAQRKGQRRNREKGKEITVVTAIGHAE